MIDYHNWSVMYDKTRQYDPMILAKIMEYIPIRENVKILDFGCGTGNYLKAVSQICPVQCFGVDVSSEMLSTAEQKKMAAKFSCGSHKHIPFSNDFFDFVYVLDVLQHIPLDELYMLFVELFRVMKPGSPVLFLTVSHQQLKKRTWNSYFPNAATIQISRFPDISQFCELGNTQKFSCETVLAIEEVRQEPISETFVNHVCNRAYSIFHLMDEQEYQKGKQRLLEDYKGKKVWNYNHGETILVFRKT